MRSQPRNRSNTGTFKSLPGPTFHPCCRLITLSARSQSPRFSGGGRRNWMWMSVAETLLAATRQAGRTQYSSPARVSLSFPKTDRVWCLHPRLPGPDQECENGSLWLADGQWLALMIATAYQNIFPATPGPCTPLGLCTWCPLLMRLL